MVNPERCLQSGMVGPAISEEVKELQQLGPLQTGLLGGGCGGGQALLGTWVPQAKLAFSISAPAIPQLAFPFLFC